MTEEQVRAMYESWAARDPEAGGRLLAADVEWVPDPRTGQSTQKGREAVIAFLEERGEMFDSLQIDVESVEFEAERLLALIRITGDGSGSGASFDINLGHVWDIRDDLMVRGQAFGDRGEAEREFRRGA